MSALSLKKLNDLNFVHLVLGPDDLVDGLPDERREAGRAAQVHLLGDDVVLTKD